MSESSSESCNTQSTLIYFEFFKQHDIQLNNRFSVVRYKRALLKVGEKDKADYLTLCNQKAWSW